MDGVISYRRGPDTQENIINEWSKYINEDVEIHRNTFGNYRKKAEELFGTEISIQSSYQKILHRR